ncbi:MAG: hypothetical protein K8U03_03875 [Planctomycetia bacterium]|nr:hypothetical protein [Planctomycetia bacterium]
MHESQRRSLLRVLFVLFCVLPTAATLLYGYAGRSKSTREAWQVRLGAASGMRVELDGIGYPRPGSALLEGLRCYDPETGALVLHCRSVETISDSEGLSLRAAGAEIFADRGARLFAALERHLRREIPDIETRIGIKADELTWHVGKESQTLVDFEGLLGPEENVQQLLVSFRLPGSDEAHPAALRVTRDTTSSPPETVVELSSGAVLLPCAMIVPLVDMADSLGKQARWNGRLKVRRTARGWEGMTSSDATEVDFRQLVGRHAVEQLWGTGEIRFHWAEFAAGRIARLRGTIVAGPGQISRDLLRAGIVHLGLGDVKTMVAEGPPLLFDRLEFDFSIDSEGLTIKSRSAEQHDALLWRDDIVYWQVPQSGPQPVANLLRALAPEREALVPLAAPTNALLGLLPLPNSGLRKPTETAEKPTLGQPRLRLRQPAADDVQLR